MMYDNCEFEFDDKEKAEHFIQQIEALRSKLGFNTTMADVKELRCGPGALGDDGYFWMQTRLSAIEPALKKKYVVSVPFLWTR